MPSSRGDAVARVVAGRAVQPAPPVLDERRDQVEATTLRKAVERDRAAPVLQGVAGLGVERPEEEGGAGDEDHAAAFHLGVGDPLAVGLPGRAQVPDRLRLAEGPQRLAGARIDCHDLPPRRGHGVDDAGHVDRRGTVEVVDVGPEVVAPPDPGDLQIGEVVAVDLVEGRRAGVAGVAAEVTPLAVLGAGQPLRRRGCGCQQRHGEGDDEEECLRSEESTHDGSIQSHRSNAARRTRPCVRGGARPLVSSQCGRSTIPNESATTAGSPDRTRAERR